MTLVNPSKERRARERATLRRKILDTARELFCKRGYEAVTMREIAKRIGYTATTIYYHFPDKETLVHALCDEDLLALTAHLKRIGEVKDPIERIRKMGMAYVLFGLEHPQPYRLLFMTAGASHDPERSAVQRGNPEQDAYAFLFRAAREAIAEGRLRSVYHDADLVAQCLWAGVHGVTSLHLALGQDRWIDWRPALVTAETLIDALLEGMLMDGRSRTGQGRQHG